MSYQTPGKMTIITKPLSQQEKEKKNGFIEKPVDEVFIKSEGKNTSNVESATVISTNQRYVIKDTTQFSTKNVH